MNISKINNTDVKIMVNGNNYIAIFSYNNINYDIETNGISKEEFINLLNFIIIFYILHLGVPHQVFL